MKAFLFLDDEGRETPLGPAGDGGYPLEGRVTGIGRSGTIRTPSWAKNISRHHCVIAHCADGKFYLIDASRFGTRFNDGGLARGVPVVLHKGDVVHLPNSVRVRMVE